MATNIIVISGNVTDKIILKKMTEGKEYCKICVACQRNYKSGNGDALTDFFDVVLFGSNARFLSLYADKGSRVTVTGRMYSNKYQTDNGQWKTGWEITADTVELHSSKPKESSPDNFDGDWSNI